MLLAYPALELPLPIYPSIDYLTPNESEAAALAAGQSLPDAAQRACVAAGLSVTKAGAATSLPSKEMVDQHAFPLPT